jgi:hypothetical protein
MPGSYTHSLLFLHQWPFLSLPLVFTKIESFSPLLLISCMPLCSVSSVLLQWFLLILLLLFHAVTYYNLDFENNFTNSFIFLFQRFNLDVFHFHMDIAYIMEHCDWLICFYYYFVYKVELKRCISCCVILVASKRHNLIIVINYQL